MSSKEYDHYLLLTPEELISLIEKKDNDIKNYQESFRKMKESRDKYYSYNQFHIEEISRLDKIIGDYKKKIVNSKDESN